MIQGKISFLNPISHIITVELTFSNLDETHTTFYLPAWRPGRYERANFVENVQKFTATDENGKHLIWKKTQSNAWQVKNGTSDFVTLRYEYFAHIMDAGNSWVDEEQVYLNFVGFLFFTPEKQKEAISIHIHLPKKFQIITSLKVKERGMYEAKDYFELIDSPLIASDQLKKLSYTVDDCLFNICFMGHHPLDHNEVMAAFEKFTKDQISAMGVFGHEYTFIIQSLPYKFYHGVEHQNSTVLVLGPNADDYKEEYWEHLMGIASHELFHAWNVTRIRPNEMSPYDLINEIVFETGFVAEGFTTYYGDLFLKTSGVINQQQFFKEVNTHLSRHFENYGRFESSLVESSRNLWVDGYKNIFPSKKVSIYTKGALASLILDLNIRKSTSNQKSLIDVMTKLNEKHTYIKGGYTKEQVFQIIEKIGGTKMKTLNSLLFDSTEDMESLLKIALEYVGCDIIQKKHDYNMTSHFGIKLSGGHIIDIAPESPAAKNLSIGDEILEINDDLFSEALARNCPSIIEIEIQRNGHTEQFTLVSNQQPYYSSYQIQLSKMLSAEQKANMSAWLK